MPRLFGAAAACCVIFAACGGGGETPLQIGIKRSALDLVFKEDDGGESKAPPQLALAPQPAPAHSGFVTSADDDLGGGGPEPPAVAACPKAGPDDFPEEPVTTVITKEPIAGLYRYRNTGTFKIEASFDLQGPYPPQASRTLKVLDPEGDAERFRYETVQRGLGANVTTTLYRVTNNSLDLVRSHTESDQGEVSFEPTPPVRLMMLGGGEGTSWTSAGVDEASGTAMVVEGSIEKRELIDVCGDVYDTYRVLSDETITNAFTGFQYETNEPTVYNVATHLGGLFLREDVDSTTTIPSDQGLVRVHLDYVSTADSVDPEPTS